MPKLRLAVAFLKLLLISAIIMLLVGLFLPSVQNAREANARLRSSHYLRQMAFACHRYDEDFHHLPDNWGTQPLGGTQIQTVELRTTWMTKILPLLECGSLICDWPAAPALSLASAVKTYVSPLDNSYAIIVEPGQRALTSYAGNPLVFNNLNMSLKQSFPDGSAFTLLVTERLMSCAGAPANGAAPQLNPWAGSVLPAPPPVTVPFPMVPEAAPATELPTLGNIAFHNTDLFTNPPVPQLAVRPKEGTPNCIPTQAQSPHHYGILCVMADAQVRFVSLRSATETAKSHPTGASNWRTVLTPAGDETLGTEW